MADRVDGLTSASFLAMGSQCRIVAAAPRDVVSRAETRVRELERRWSRFLADSEVSGASRGSGTLCMVSEDTFLLMSVSETARRWSRGAFNPLMLDHIRTLGYERSWNSATVAKPVSGPSAPACAEPIELYESISAVVIPAGTGFDPGGIGKGLAADIVCDELTASGATTVMVDLGGDLRVSGTPWHAEQWSIDIAAPQQRDGQAGRLTLAESGAVATSSVVSKRWRSDGLVHHHVLDPATGQSAETDLLTVSVAASDGLASRGRRKGWVARRFERRLWTSSLALAFTASHFRRQGNH